mgnify:CR=1 FL=1
MNKRPIIVFITALVCGAIIGLLLRPLIFASVSSNAVGSQSMEAEDISQSSGMPTANLTKIPSQKAKIATDLAKVSGAKRSLWLAAQVEGATPDQLAHLLALAKQSGHKDGDLERAIAVRWAELDPVHMIDAFLKDDESNGRLWVILFDSWAKSDPRNALDHFLAARESGSGGGEWNDLLWQKLIEYAPEIGIEAGKRLNPFSIPNVSSIRSWAAKDPQSAAESILKHLGTNRASAELMREVGKAWGDTDPKEALAYAAALPSTKLRANLTENVVRSWTEKEPEAAAAFVAAEEDPFVRAQLGLALAAGLAEIDPEIALSWADENLQSGARSTAVGEAVKVMAERDIESAAALVSKMEPGGAMNRAVTELASVWAASDSSNNAAMLSWIGSQPDAEMRKTAMRRLEWEIMGYNGEGLIGFVAGDHGHLATDEMIERAAMKRAGQNAQSAIAWAKALPADRSEIALRTVTETLQRLAPTESSDVR